MTMRLLTLATGLVTASMLFSCSADTGGSEKSADSSSAKTSTESIASPSASSAPRHSKAQLRESLLTLSDMPETGFTASAPNDDRERTYFCDYTPPVEPIDTATSEFEKAEGLGFSLVRSNVDQFASASDAKAQMDKLVDVMKTCTEAKVDGIKQTYALMSAPALGEASVAVRIDMTLEGMDVVMHQLYVLSGRSMLQTSTASAGMATPEAKVASDLAEKHLDKFEKATSN